MALVYMYMKRIVKILMDRDGLSREEAEDQITAFTSEMWLDIGQGGDPSEWEHIFMSEFSLEPDFFELLIF